MGNFILFILVLFALAALLKIDFFFTILYLFIGVYLVARIWSRRALKNLRITRHMEQRVFLGERITITLKAQNLSRLPVPWLLINDSFSTVLSTPPFFRQIITLGSRATQILPYDLVARRRGYYQIGPMTLETGDLLGINRRLQGQIEADYLIVYPKILPITRLGLPTYSPQVILPTPMPLFHDANRITGVRNYVQGDNPRHIHWPATAATGQLLVKQFQTAIARDNVMFLNLDRADYGRPGQASVAIELAIVVAASLANHMLMFEALPVGLTTTGFDPLTKSRQTFRLRPDKGRRHLMQILEVLARVEGSDDVTFLKSLQQEAIHLSWGSTLIIITSTQSPELFSTALLLKRSGFQVTLVMVQPAAYIYPQLKRVEELGIQTFQIKREKDIEAWLPAA